MNKDGYITKAEFQTVMGDIQLNVEEWNEFLDECDINKDGKVTKRQSFFSNSL